MSFIDLRFERRSVRRVAVVPRQRMTQPSNERAIPVPGNRDEGSRLPELRVLEQDVYRDTRGTFAELWRNDDARASGLPAFVQDNLARSRRGVVRGLHFQNPRAQA